MSFIHVFYLTGGVPNSRWLVNYDYDLLDGLVLGACLGAYCPFLINTHLNDMYTKPETAEQCLHNALKVLFWGLSTYSVFEKIECPVK